MTPLRPRSRARARAVPVAAVRSAPERPARARSFAPYANLLLGAWLIAASFVLPRPGNTGFNMVVTGILVVLCAACAIWAPAFRFGTMTLAIWFLATELFVFEDPAPTLLHNVVVGLAMLALSMVPYREKLVDPNQPAVHEGFLD